MKKKVEHEMHSGAQALNPKTCGYDTFLHGLQRPASQHIEHQLANRKPVSTSTQAIMNINHSIPHICSLLRPIVQNVCLILP